MKRLNILKNLKYIAVILLIEEIKFLYTFFILHYEKYYV